MKKNRVEITIVTSKESDKPKDPPRRWQEIDRLKEEIALARHLNEIDNFGVLDEAS